MNKIKLKNQFTNISKLKVSSIISVLSQAHWHDQNEEKLPFCKYVFLNIFLTR